MTVTRRHTALDGMESLAIYSPCEKYRYVLERRWGQGRKMMVMVMLNPSTATETQNDPTVERCERRARSWGFDGLRVLNIFAYRATDPKDMKQADDPVGPLNDAYLFDALDMCKTRPDNMILCGWGCHGEHAGRAGKVMNMFASHGLKPLALGWTVQGFPQHPLYIGYDQKPLERPA